VWREGEKLQGLNRLWKIPVVLDLRRYGSVPHSGFGMGIERIVAWICGLDHVRETIPFARTLHRIYP